MAKCEVCKKNIEATFLGKLAGTIVYDERNKKRIVCSNCQKALGNDREKILEKVR